MLEWLRSFWRRWFGGEPIPAEPTTTQVSVGVRVKMHVRCVGRNGEVLWDQWAQVTVNVNAGVLLSTAIQSAVEWLQSGGPAMRGWRSCPNPELVELGDILLVEKPFDNPALTV